MSPLEFIPKSLLGIAIVALLTSNVYFAIDGWHIKLELSRKATELARTREEHANAVAVAAERSIEVAKGFRKKERGMQVAMDTQREKTDETVTALAAQRDALKLRLQSVTASDTSGYGLAPAVASLKEATAGDHFALIPDEVGVLVDEAFRADQIRVELLGCYSAYDTARGAIK